MAMINKANDTDLKNRFKWLHGLSLAVNILQLFLLLYILWRIL